MKIRVKETLTLMLLALPCIVFARKLAPEVEYAMAYGAEAKICLKVFDDTILSVGANNGGIECDDFQIKTRSRADISACCRPKYADGGADEVPAEEPTGDDSVYAIQKWLNELLKLLIVKY